MYGEVTERTCCAEYAMRWGVTGMSRSDLRVTAGVVGADAGIMGCLFVILVAVDVAVVVVE